MRLKAFTLTEMMVVLVIIAALMALALPLVSSLVREANSDLTLSMIDSAGKNARSYVKTRQKIFTAVDAENDVRKYSGVAVVFTTENTMALYESIEASIVYGVGSFENADGELVYQAKQGNRTVGPLMDRGPTVETGKVLDAEYLAFQKVSTWEEVSLPKQSVILGIIMDGGKTKFITPPFALRFNASSQLAYHSDSSPKSYVMIDGDYDLIFDTTNKRDSYDFLKWYKYSDQYQRFEPSNNPSQPGKFRHTDLNSITSASDRSKYAKFSPYDGQIKFPFDRLEAAMGIVIVDSNTFLPAFENKTSQDLITTDSELGKWILQNGSVVMFNPQTGAAELGLIHGKQ